MSRSYRLIWIAGLVAAVTLTVAAFAFSLLTALSAQGLRCAAQSVLAGHRSGVVDLFGFPLFCAIAFGICFAALRAALKRESTNRLLAIADSLTVFEFLSMRIGYGMFGFVIGILTLLFMIGMTARYCVVRYIDIAHYCQVGASG